MRLPRPEYQPSLLTAACGRCRFFSSAAGACASARPGSGRGGAAGGRPAPGPASPRPPARRGCRRRGRGGPWSDLDLLPVAVDRRGAASGSSWSASPRSARRSGWPVRDAAQDAAGMVGEERDRAVRAHAHLVGILLAASSAAAAKPSPISTPFTALMHISARGDVGIELAVDRRAEAGGHAVRHHLDHRAERGAGLARGASSASSHRAAAARSGQKKGFSSTVRPVPVGAVDASRRRSATSAPRMRHAGAEHLARDGAGGDAHRGLARARSARRRDSRGCRISGRRSGRHGRGGSGP